MLRAILWAKAHMSPLESRRLEPREDSLQPRRGKIEESTDLDRQKPVGCVHEIDRQRCRLEFVEQGRQGSALEGSLEVIGKSGRNSDSGTCGVTGRLGAADHEPRPHRHRNGRLAFEECPDIG